MQVLWLSFAVWCSLSLTLTATLPTTTPDFDQGTNTPNSEVPREFPKLTQNYTFVDNSSIRANLASHAQNDTEVEDLLARDDNEKVIAVEPESSELEEDIGRKSEVEWIEDGGDTEDTKFDSTEEKLETSTQGEIETTTPKQIETSTKTWTETSTEKKLETSTQAASTEEKIVTDVASTSNEESTESSTITAKIEAYRDGVPLLNGTVGAILIGVFLVVCIAGYSALILWRRSLELKYGSREMLVDKDDFYDPDDLRHFSI